MLIDTHTHLYDEKFDEDRDLMIARAIEQGIEKMYLPNCNSETIAGMLEVEKKYPTNCFAMMGLHPCYVKEDVENELNIVKEWLDKRTFCAIGEIGLDYYWDKTFASQQQQAFRTQIEWSIEFKVPIVIHTREATQDTLSIVKEYVPKGVKGVFHCFSGSYETAQQIIDMGFYLGIGGVLTYKKAGLQEVVQKVDLKHLVLETDAPYLTPTPHRGKRNESAYTRFVAEKLAELKATDIKEVAEITTANAMKLFQLD
jgi:TatD DNase family protein